MPSGNECEVTRAHVRYSGPGRGTPRRWRAARLALAAAALIVVGLPFPALASQTTREGHPSYAAGSFSPCRHGAIMRAYPRFRIFACKNGPSALIDIKTARADLNSLWGPETRLMGDPVPDNSLPGEHGRIDFYLVTTGQKLSRGAYTGTQAIDLSKDDDLGQAPWDAINGSVSSAFVVALRPESLPHGDSFKSVLAHELFHVLQFAHNTTRSCPKFWFLEASAKWAEWYFVPQAAGPMVYPWFRDFQAKPEVSLTDSKNRTPYADWMWPLFMQQQAGGSPEPVALAWKAMDGETGCTALNADVSLQDSFGKDFADFAVENFDYRLPNLIHGKVRAWPVDFKDNYPRFRQEANPGAPAFPEELPKYDSVALNQDFYPYDATVHVDLPPLAARYWQIPLVPPFGQVGAGGSVEFDFSGLSPAGNTDVSLLAADGQTSGYATNNGVWKRIDLGGGATQAKICLNADGTKENRQLKGAFYVIIDNHSSGSSAAPVTGSYTVKQEPYVCAKRLSGSLAITTKETFSGGGGTDQSAQLTINISSEDKRFGIWQVGPGSSWSEQYTGLGDGCSGSSSGKLTNQDLGLPVVGRESNFNLYDQPYSFKPFLIPILLNTESVICGQSPVSLGIGDGCPEPPFSFTTGTYTRADAGIDFTCSTSQSGNGVTFTESVSGTLTATDPIECGLWTKNCPIGTKP